MAEQSPEPELIFVCEIMPGDVKKQKAASNTADTGGGARDLRLQPDDAFLRILKPMFPDPVGTGGATKGTIHWTDADKNKQSAEISLWPPTKARPGEARIATIQKIGVWSVSEEDYEAAAEQGHQWFYVLLMDTDKVTRAYVLKEEQLDRWRPQVRDYVRKRLDEAPKRKTPIHVVGTKNFVTGEEYP